jgi:23S rRNA pseudouridine1911/1915/1917 synthase
MPAPRIVDLTPSDPARAAGARLDKYLADRAAEADSPIAAMSRSRLQKLIDTGMVTVNDQPARASTKLFGNERIAVTLPPPEKLDLEPEAIPLNVIYEDADLIVVNKSPDIVVHPGAGRRTGTLVNALLAHVSDLSGIGGVARPGIVHRLDRGTSGCLVVAKNDKAHESLTRQFSNREVTKRYTAFVLGVPATAKAHIVTLYGRHPTQRKRFTTKVPVGKKAITDYEVVRSGGGIAELDVLLGTGRTHQIRVHLSETHHPVIGDATYGGKAFARVTDPELRALCEALTHQALHARELGFTQPTTGVKLAFTAPLPPDLAAIAAKL